VGKTTTVINLATAMAACDKRTLIIDSDPQGNTSTGLGVMQEDRDKDLYSVICSTTDIKSSIKKTIIPKLDLIPTSPNLSVLEQELVNIEDREFQLKERIQEIEDYYDYIFIDCPPSLGLLTLNALCAAKNLIVPLQTEYYALEGLTQLMKTFDLIKINFNKDIKLQGILLTMYDKRNKICEMVAEDVRNHFGKKVFNTIIPRNVRVSEAPSYGQPVLMYDISCPGSQAYAALAGEIINQEK
jgi:chromosome partitioning protein